MTFDKNDLAELTYGLIFAGGFWWEGWNPFLGFMIGIVISLFIEVYGE